VIPILIRCGLRKFVSVNSTKLNNQKIGLFFSEIKNYRGKEVTFLQANTFEEAFDKITI